MNEAVKTVTDQSFQLDVIQSSKPVLVDYWADWCAPCKMIGPLVDGAAMQYSDRLTVAKLNVDKNPATATRYQVFSIPTLMLFKDGSPVAVHVGSLSKGQLDAFLEAHTR
jgi:thioredoxin 1